MSERGRKTHRILHSIDPVFDAHSCEIEGSLDSAIRDPEPNDLGAIFKAARIQAVFVNGRKAESLYRKFHAQASGMEAIYLPSTSPANRKSYDFEGLCRAWELILQHIQLRRG